MVKLVKNNFDSVKISNPEENVVVRLSLLAKQIQFRIRTDSNLYVYSEYDISSL